VAIGFLFSDFDLLISTLESDSNHLIEWFKINKMQANPDKFQVLAVGKKTYEKRPAINIPIIPPFDFHFRIYKRDLAILTE
jgi:hypothetical protein